MTRTEENARANVVDNAFLILRALYEKNAVVGSDLPLDELRKIVRLLPDKFDDADYHLSQKRMIDGTMGGCRWITLPGLEYVHAELQNRVVSTLAGELLMRFLIEREKTSVFASPKTICEELGLSREQYHEIAQELVDIGLVTVTHGVLSDPFHGLRVTSEGRNAARRGFRRKKVVAATTYNIGAVVAELKGGSVQAVGAVVDSTVSQVVNDPQFLTGVIERISGELLDVVRGELSGIDLEQYTRTLEQLREDLLSDRPDETRVKRGLRLLAFLGDVEGNIALVARVWALLAPFLPLVVAKFAS